MTLAEVDQRKLSKSASRLLDLFRWFEWTCGQIFPNQRTLKKHLKMGVRQIQRLIRELREARLLKVVRRWRKSNVYFLAPTQQLSFDFDGVDNPVEPSGNPREAEANVVIESSRSSFVLPSGINQRIESMSTIAEGCVENLAKTQTQKPSFECKNAKAEPTLDQPLTLAEAREMYKLATPSETAENIERSAHKLLGDTPKPGSVTKWLMSGPAEFRPPDARESTRNAGLRAPQSKRTPLSRPPASSSSSRLENSPGDVVAMKLTIRELSVKKRLA